jgi:hypothetical protein
MNVEATNPPTSQTAPPPRLMIKDFLSAFDSISCFHSCSQPANDLLSSPGFISSTVALLID